MENRIGFKAYVEVVAVFTPDGTLRPLYLVWEDGRRYDIDKIKSVCREANRRAGGCGICYTCRIMGRDIKLYYEENYRWFVEAKGD